MRALILVCLKHLLVADLLPDVSEVAHEPEPNPFEILRVSCRVVLESTAQHTGRALASNMSMYTPMTVR
jgi:hypothetical protein